MSANTDIYNSADFIELLIKHLIRSKEVLAKAKQIGLRGDDLLTSLEFGIRVYKTFADIALEIGAAPIEQELLGVFLRSKIEAGDIHPNMVDQASLLFAWIYNDTNPLTPDYYVSNLQEFIKHRRQEKAKTQHADDNEALRSELNKINVDLSKEEVLSKALAVNPFTTLVKKDIHDLILTGMTRLDIACGGGLGYSEFTILVGFSGGGKTALGTNIATRTALGGKKVIYMSLEESFEDLSNRFYAQIFRINYSNLHNGSAYMELEEKFGSMDAITEDHRKALESNLRIIALKELAPLKPVQLYELAEQEYEKDGFLPDLIVVDQLQFLEPDEKIEGEQQWLREQRTAEDLDKMSHRKLGPNNKAYSIFALHQAKGKLKRNFSNEDIAGFKGIVQKPENVWGIGRANPTSNDFEIFSLKSRHSKNFQLDYVGDLEFMTFADPLTGGTTASSREVTHGTARVEKSPAQLIKEAGPKKEEAQNLGQVKQLLSPAVTT